MTSSPTTDLLREHAEDECCDVTTIGRRTGRPHRIEIWFGVLEDEVVLISGGGASADWYRNALASGSAVLHVAGVDVRVSASAITDPEERRRAGELMAAKYPWDGDPSIGLTRQRWCYEVPALRLTPV